MQEKDNAPKAAPYGLSYQPEGSTKLYYFLLVDPEKEEEFRKVLRGTVPFNIKAYGTLVASGEGDPPEHVRKALREKFGDVKNEPPQPIPSLEQKLETFDMLLHQYELLEELAAAASELGPGAFERVKALMATLSAALEMTTSAYADYAESGQRPTEEHGLAVGQAAMNTIIALADFLSEVEAANGLWDSQDYRLRAKIASVDDLDVFSQSTRHRLPRLRDKQQTVP